MAFAVVGKLTVRICVVNEESQSTAFTTHGVFNHLYVTVRIAECQNRTVTNVLIDSYWLARLGVTICKDGANTRFKYYEKNQRQI